MRRRHAIFIFSFTRLLPRHVAKMAMLIIFATPFTLPLDAADITTIFQMGEKPPLRHFHADIFGADA